MFSVTSEQGVKVERVNAELTLEATPETVVAGDTVTFVAGVDIESVDGISVPRGLTKWEWIPDGGQPVQVCAWFSWTCKLQVTKPGTMRITGTANGVGKTKERAIQVIVPKLLIVPAVHYAKVGDTTRWVAKLVPSTRPDGSAIPWSISNWRWHLAPPSNQSFFSCGAVTSCKTGPYAVGDQDGFIKAWGSVNGVADSATANVHLIPCPTNDSIADRRDVRQQFKVVLDSSNVNDPNIENRRERTGVILQDTLTGAVVVSFLEGYTDWCKSVMLPIPTSLGPYRLIGTFHTHPYMPNVDSIARCPVLVQDPVTGQWGRKQPPEWETGIGVAGEGPSNLDDRPSLAQQTLELLRRGWPPVDECIIDKKNIYRVRGTNALAPFGPYDTYQHSACVNWLN